jgi:hypothetical protein
MAIQPSTRAAGSSLILHYRGTLVLGANAFGDYSPAIANGVVPSDVADGTVIGVRFLLADATDPTDTATLLPLAAFDDSQPAGAAPHAPVFSAVAGITTATDQIISSRTWAQNTHIVIQPQNAASAASLVGVETDKAQIVLDLTDSGLGGNTGLPVLILPMIFTFADAAFVPADIEMFVEIRHTHSR